MNLMRRIVIALAAIAVLLGVGFVNEASAEGLNFGTADLTSVDVFVHGTGPAPQSSIVSVLPGWRAEIAPAYGTRSMDESEVEGADLLADYIVDRAAKGESTSIASYSLGSTITGDAIQRIAQERQVDLSLITADIMSDPRFRETGITQVLNGGIWPYLLPSIGITPNGHRSNFGGASVTEVCINFDGICDLKTGVWGSMNSAFGYFTIHGSKDPICNYSNFENLDVTVRVESGVTQKTANCGLPVLRAIEMATANELPDVVHAVGEALVETTGDPGQVQTTKTFEQTAQDVATAIAPELPTFEEVVAPVQQWAADTVQQWTAPAAPIEAAPAVDYVAPVLEQAAAAVNDFAATLPADLGNQVNDLAAQGLALIGAGR
ncbi:hypothetical protein A2791_00365 [Candidatus Saccharibacteria bacterium RIFCSPHIGHO2_01_FULL_46_30]|nr:MAG: hypothetical protein A2791_00365 [Candidatus Saccharibacteria bacterium RIFCSPHIGHO2_01_FULL_46_30]